MEAKIYKMKNECRYSIIVTLAMVFAINLFNVKPVRSQAILIGPGDELKVDVFRLPEHSGNFTVRTDGTIIVPGVGAVAVAGLTSNEATTAISKQLSGRTTSNSLISVDISRYRPIFVLGQVMTPGRYDYLEGMTVLHAIAVAGGMNKIVNSDNSMSTSIIRERERLAKLRIDVENHEKTIAQLKAEATTIKASLNLIQTGKNENQEKDPKVNYEFMEAKRNKVAKLYDLLKSELIAIDSEVKFLNNKIRDSSEISELMRKTLLQYEALAEKKLFRMKDLTDVKRDSFLTNIEELNARAAVERAKQRKIEIEKQISELKFKETFEPLIEALETEKRLALLMEEVKFAEETLRNYVGISATLAQNSNFRSQIKEKYILFRHDENTMKQINATELTKLLPGDLLKVEIEGFFTN